MSRGIRGCVHGAQDVSELPAGPGGGGISLLPRLPLLRQPTALVHPGCGFVGTVVERSEKLVE